jgi:hypothetical protein
MDDNESVLNKNRPKAYGVETASGCLDEENRVKPEEFGVHHMITRQVYNYEVPAN